MEPEGGADDAGGPADAGPDAAAAHAGTAGVKSSSCGCGMIGRGGEAGVLAALAFSVAGLARRRKQ